MDATVAMARSQGAPASPVRGLARFKKVGNKVKTLMTITMEAAEEPQREALLDFFSVTGGLKSHPNGWRNKTNWKKPFSDLNTWYGITTDREGNVTEIRLSFNHLRMAAGSELPLGIFERLPHLEVLDLRANRLQGRIPLDLAMCTKLRLLSLRSNPDLLPPRRAPMDEKLGMCCASTRTRPDTPPPPTPRPI